jgi:hypothetical protein
VAVAGGQVLARMLPTMPLLEEVAVAAQGMRRQGRRRARTPSLPSTLLRFRHPLSSCAFVSRAHACRLPAPSVCSTATPLSTRCGCTRGLPRWRRGRTGCGTGRRTLRRGGPCTPRRRACWMWCSLQRLLLLLRLLCHHRRRRRRWVRLALRAHLPAGLGQGQGLRLRLPHRRTFLLALVVQTKREKVAPSEIGSAGSNMSVVFTGAGTGMAEEEGDEVRKAKAAATAVPNRRFAQKTTKKEAAATEGAETHPTSTQTRGRSTSANGTTGSR